MDEIAALQEALRQAQALDTVHRLSEFNCIELVSKLLESGTLEVMYTTNGKEYVTMRQLIREVQDEVLTNGGRVNMVDIPPVLAMDMIHVEKAAAEAVRADSELMLVDGELVATYYLDDIALEIEEALMEKGSMTLASLAKQYNFTTEFMTQTVQQRLGTHISGRLTKHVLYTQAYVERHAAITRGMLAAVTRPVSIGELAQSHSLEIDLVFESVKSLIAAGDLAGSLKGGQKNAAIFVPKVYADAQKQAVEDFFNSNQFIEYAKLDRLNVQGDAKTYLRTLFPNGKALSSVFVHPSIVDHLEGAVEETAAQSTVLDVETLVPPSYSTADVESLLKLVPALNGKRPLCQIYADRFVVASAYIDALLEHFKADAITRSEKAVTAMREAEVTGDANVEEQSVAATKGGKKKDKVPDKTKSQSSFDLELEGEEEEDWSTGKKKGKGKGKKANKAPAAPSKDAPSSKKGKGKKGKQGNEGADEEFGDAATAEELAEVVSQRDRDVPEELALAIGEALAGRVTDMRKEARVTVFTSSVTFTKEQKDKYATDIGQHYQDLCIYAKGQAILEPPKEGDEGEEVASDGVVLRHLCKTLGWDLLHLILEYQTLLCLPERVAVNAKTRDRALKQLPSEVGELFTKPVAKLNSRDLEGFLGDIEVVAQESSILLPRCDKKSTRARVFEMKAALLHDMELETSPATVLLQACLTLFTSAHPTASVTGPGRIIGPLLSNLQPLMVEEPWGVLSEMHETLVQHAQQHSTNPDSPELNPLAQKLESMVPRVKEIAKDKSNLRPSSQRDKA